MAEFKGVFPAIITPMTEDSKLNEDAFRAVMEDNIRAGVQGFWVAGGTGESVLLTDEENMRIAEIASDQNQGRITNIMHVGATTTVRAARMAEHAAKQGVEAICCVPHFFYRSTDEAIVEHYRVVGAAADLPLFIYNLPAATGVEITPDLMAKIKDGVPQLAGLKHSSTDFPATAEFVRMGLDCFIGNGRLMLPALTLGATGCIDGPLCAAPELWLEIWNAYNDGDIKRAEKAQESATSFNNLAVSRPFPSGLKALVSKRLGIDCGSARLPMAPLTTEEKVAIADEAARLDIFKVAVA